MAENLNILKTLEDFVEVIFFNLIKILKNFKKIYSDNRYFS